MSVRVKNCNTRGQSSRKLVGFCTGWQKSPKVSEAAHLNRYLPPPGANSCHPFAKCVSAELLFKPLYGHYGAILTFHVEVAAGDASHLNLPQVVLHTKLCERDGDFERKTMRRGKKIHRRDISLHSVTK